ncbi:hypothetical protein [Fructilactobacillus florum]|nr:hypothetical protein [Fructilactobacillus florum]
MMTLVDTDDITAIYRINTEKPEESSVEFYGDATDDQFFEATVDGLAKTLAMMRHKSDKQSLDYSADDLANKFYSACEELDKEKADD